MKNIVLTIFLTLFSSTITMSQQFNSNAFTSGYVPVNGLKLYYEIHGEGKPLVLLHGAYMNIDLQFSQFIPELTKFKKVIALEMQGHGRTADTDRPFSYESLAEDVAGLLKHLNIDKADILGYSLGGTVALQLGIRHPELVDKMVIISSVFKHDGWLPEALELFKTTTPALFKNTPLKTSYDSLAPDPQYWSQFVNKLAAFDNLPFNLGEDNVKALQSPVLFIMGDNDGVDLSHKAEMYRLCGGDVFGDINGLPKSQLAIIPATTHVNIMMDTEKLVFLIQPFLDNVPATARH